MNDLENTDLPAQLKACIKGAYRLSLLLGIVASIASPVWAQTISVDGTTPTTLNRRARSCSGNCTITGGSRSGGNLFHSFNRFGVDRGGTVTFIDPGVRNIITRVTGRDISVIDGLLKVSGGNANLFLFNPNGITFGDGASLQLGGSFFASTASGVAFEDGAFSLTDNSATRSLLTVNVPIGLQVGVNPGNITVRGKGNHLFTNPNLLIDRSLVAPNLQASQTLGLLGGQIRLNGAVLSVPGGRVEVGSVRNSFVNLIPTGQGFRLGYGDVETFGNIILKNAALIDVSAVSAGDVQLRGQAVTLTDGSAILAGTLGNGRGGRVRVQADTLSATGASAFVPSFVPSEVGKLVVMPSGIFAGVDANAAGIGGEIDLQIGQLTLSEGAQIATGTFGSGNAGNLNVVANTITASGGRPAGPTGLFTTVAAAADGGPNGAATGNGGHLNISTDVLSLQNGAQISAGTLGFGHAGNLTIRSNLTQIMGSFGVPGAGGPSSIRSASERPWAGAGGRVTIDTNRLVVADGGQIVTGTLSPNNAGSLIVRAEQIELRGGDAFGRSGLLSNAVDYQANGNNGKGGNIAVNTRDLLISNRATISVSNTPSGDNPDLTPGQGAAGNLTITAQNIRLNSGSSLNADTLNGDRANIRVAAERLTLQNSRISTNATGTATGGNIHLDLDGLTLLNDSTISANSAFSFGGQVAINTNVLAQSSASSITATSALGPEFDGVVEINMVEQPTNEAQIQTENPTEKKQIIAACEQLTQNELTVTGQGGLPIDPTQTLTTPGIWSDLRSFHTENSNLTQAETARFESRTQNRTSDPTRVINQAQAITQAQRMVRNAQGQLVLVAETENRSDTAFLAESASLCN